MKNKREISKIKRRNAKLYPIYKMFSWDRLFFYSVEFLFYTITKKITVSEILIVNAFYLLFRIFGQIPAVMITDFLGKRKSIILGNLFLIIYMLILLTLPGAFSIILANLFMAIGYDIKLIAESNLIYDSVSTKGGEGLYSKLEAKGQSLYYILDGIASLISGYFFIINNYLPMYICLGFIVMSMIISFGFKDVYEVKISQKNINDILKEYTNDIKLSFKFVLKSGRMKAYILFQIVFYSIIKIIEIYRGDLLIDLGVSEEKFSIIFAVLTLIGGFSISSKKYIEKKFKNRTLAFLSLSYIVASIFIGIIATFWKGKFILPIILVMYVILKISTSIWYILEYKYLKNFTTENIRNKITFAYEFIGGIAISAVSFLSSLLLKVLSAENVFLIVGLISLVCMLLTLKYMKTRIGLDAQQYKKEDIQF